MFRGDARQGPHSDLIRCKNRGTPSGVYRLENLLPWFRAQCGSQAAFNFDSMGGAWIVLMFFGTLGYPVCQLAPSIDRR